MSKNEKGKQGKQEVSEAVAEQADLAAIDGRTDIVGAYCPHCDEKVSILISTPFDLSVPIGGALFKTGEEASQFLDRTMEHVRELEEELRASLGVETDPPPDRQDEEEDA